MVVGSKEANGIGDEEKRQLRPYRYLVFLLFWLAVTSLCGLLIRGVIRHLDRMPSVATFASLDAVDERALLACGEDLRKLEVEVRARFAKLITGPPQASNDAPWDALERRRLEIVARCRLSELGDDPLATALNTAAGEIERLIRGFALMFERYDNEVRGHSSEAQGHLERARSIVKSR